MGVAAKRSLDEELVGLVFALGNRLREHFQSRVVEFDLSPPQVHALHLLSTGPRPMGELAEAMRCDASNITGIVDRLESRGYVERRADQADRRVRTLVLTEAGARVTEALRGRLFEGDGPFAGLSRRERQALRDLLARVAAEG